MFINTKEHFMLTNYYYEKLEQKISEIKISKTPLSVEWRDVD